MQLVVELGVKLRASYSQTRALSHNGASPPHFAQLAGGWQRKLLPGILGRTCLVAEVTEEAEGTGQEETGQELWEEKISLPLSFCISCLCVSLCPLHLCNCPFFPYRLECLLTLGAPRGPGTELCFVFGVVVLLYFFFVFCFHRAGA